MSISIQCPSCLYLTRVADAMVGRRVRCPDCDHAFVVTAPERDEPHPVPDISLAFLDEEEDAPFRDEPRLAPLVSRSVSTPQTIPLARRSASAAVAPVSSSSIYVGLSIGLACAVSLSAAFAIFLR
jgi:hypothetical protein